MTNLSDLNNIYADLAENTYEDRPVSFSELQDDTKSINIKFKDAVNSYGENQSSVFLQPDNSNSGLMEDKESGFNSYFLTDTKEFNQDTKHTYFAIRGSDGDIFGNKNDWVENDINFAITDDYIPQAKLATNAIDQKVKEMIEKSPNATLSVTGHSLGTMVSIQGVANLPAVSINKIDKVILFDGPDARNSINKMSDQARDNIEKLEAAGKIDYYVNPFDIVSMLNRNQPGVDELGNVHYLLPKSATSSFDSDSAHDFGQIQLNSDGSPQEATLKDNPEYIMAGIQISHTLNPLVTVLESTLGVFVGGKQEVYQLVSKLMAAYGEGGIEGVKNVLLAAGLSLAGLPIITNSLATAYLKYNSIISEANEKSKFGSEISALKDKISKSQNTEETLALEAELAATVIQQTKYLTEEYTKIYKEYVKEYEDEVNSIVLDVHNNAYSIKHYLSDSEVMGLIADFTKPVLWDGGKKSTDDSEVTAYGNKLSKFATELAGFSDAMTKFDQDHARSVETSDLLTGKSTVKSKYK